MPVAIVTGSGGLIETGSARHYVEQAFDDIGVENDMRARFVAQSALMRYDG